MVPGSEIGTGYLKNCLLRGNMKFFIFFAAVFLARVGEAKNKPLENVYGKAKAAVSVQDYQYTDTFHFMRFVSGSESQINEFSALTEFRPYELCERFGKKYFILVTRNVFS